MPTIHAAAALIGPRAVLIRGPSGAGKSRLTLALIEAGIDGRLPFTRMVADDRTYIEAVNGRLLVRVPDALAGWLEVRGLGIRRVPYESVAVAGWVADLGGEAPRLPAPEDTEVVLQGVALPRFFLGACADPLLVLLAALRSAVSEEAPIAAVQHYRD